MVYMEENKSNNANILFISPANMQQLLINSIIKLNQMNYMPSIQKQLTP